MEEILCILTVSWNCSFLKQFSLLALFLTAFSEGKTHKSVSLLIVKDCKTLRQFCPCKTICMVVQLFSLRCELCGFIPLNLSRTVI